MDRGLAVVDLVGTVVTGRLVVLGLIVVLTVVGGLTVDELGFEPSQPTSSEPSKHSMISLHLALILTHPPYAHLYV